VSPLSPDRSIDAYGFVHAPLHRRVSPESKAQAIRADPVSDAPGAKL
jgi:hypothetical protein